MLVCETCRQRLVYVREPACKKCGKPLEKEEAEYCADCSRRKHAYARGKAVFPYDRLMRASIARFKYRGRREYADFYAEELVKRCGELLLSGGEEASSEDEEDQPPEGAERRAETGQSEKCFSSQPK